MHAYIMHTYLHTHTINIYIQTYIHTYIHTIHTHTRSQIKAILDFLDSLSNYIISNLKLYIPIARIKIAVAKICFSYAIVIESVARAKLLTAGGSIAAVNGCAGARRGRPGKTSGGRARRMA